MARRSWFGDSERETDPAGPAGRPPGPFSGSIERLESWQRAIEDGIIEPHEVAEQKERVVALLRELEPMLDDEQHEKVTRVLEEWTVLSAMHGTLLVEEFGGGRDSFQAAVPPDEPPSEDLDKSAEGAPFGVVGAEPQDLDKSAEGAPFGVVGAEPQDLDKSAEGTPFGVVGAEPQDLDRAKAPLKVGEPRD